MILRRASRPFITGIRNQNQDIGLQRTDIPAPRLAVLAEPDGNLTAAFEDILQNLAQKGRIIGDNGMDHSSDF